MDGVRSKAAGGDQKAAEEGLLLNILVELKRGREEREED